MNKPSLALAAALAVAMGICPWRASAARPNPTSAPAAGDAAVHDENPTAARAVVVRTLQNYQDLVAHFNDHYGIYGDFTKADLQEMQADYAPVLAAWQTALDAYDKKDFALAHELRLKAMATKPKFDWEKRLEFREKQARLMPGEDLLQGENGHNVAGRLDKELDDAIEARKRASEAWGLVAGAAEQDQPDDKVEQFKQLAGPLERAADIDWWWYVWLRDSGTGISAAYLESPPAQKLEEQLTSLESQRLAIEPVDIDELGRPHRQFPHPRNPRQHATAAQIAAEQLQEQKERDLQQLQQSIVTLRQQFLQEGRAYTAQHPQAPHRNRQS